LNSLLFTPKDFNPSPLISLWRIKIKAFMADALNLHLLLVHVGLQIPRLARPMDLTKSFEAPF
jgi:hypothetical protein